jgi:subtilase family serine protease
MPLRSVDPGYEHRVDRYFDAGNPGEIRYPAGGSSGVVRIDPEILDRPMNVAVRWYQKDPGGAAPDGIVAVAKSAYWSIAHIPRAADHSSAMWFDYGEIPGVVEPNDLRLLYRPTATSPWQVIPADVDANALEIRTAGVTALAGDWTVGTVSSANPLSTDPPAMVSSPTPTDGALAAAIRPLFRWSGGPDAATFDLYIWPSTAAEPTGPTRSGLQTPQVQLTDDLEFGETYHWRVLAHNINGETPGPVWTFTVGPVPDLTVTSLTGPETGFSGQEVVVGWTVTNMGGGGTNVPAWYDEVYLSASADFQRNLATRIGRSRNLSFLNPGESYLGSLAFVLPDGIEGVRYLHVVSDDSDLMAEADESNNVASKGLSVTLSPYADLEVEGLIVPSDVFSGDSIDVTFTVSNVGDGRTSATSWVDSIFLSDDEVFDYNFTSSESVLRVNERLVGTSEHIGALEPGESYSTTTRIRLPDDAIGDRYVFVYTDIPGGSKQSIGGEVYEFNQDLDNWTGRAIAITLTPPPDLVVTSVVPPPAAQSGERVDLSWTVENRGPGGTRATRWRDVAYISETPEFDALQAVVLGLHEHIGSLEPDEQYVRSARITVPDGFEGAGYFFIETDVDARVFEFTFETNNMGGASAPVSVTRAPYPDLQVSGIDVSTSSAVAGDELAVSYTVSNHGTAPVDRTRVDSVYVVPGHVWDPGVARRVAAFTQTAPLGIGESRTETVAVTIPDDVEGTVHLFVRPDARNDVFEYPDLVNNVAGNGPVVVAPYPTADLAAAFSVAPEPAHTGEMVPLSLSVTNVGEGRTRVAEWNDRVYLSADEALDPAVDRLLLSSRHTGSLSSGEGYAISGVHLPDDVPGDWYLIVLVDSEGILAESYEMNNRANVPLTVALSTPSDLRVTDLEAPESVHAGQTAVIAWTVHNDGSGATRSSASSGGWFDSVYLSPDGRLDGNDLLLGTIERSPGLESGASYQTSLSVPVPASASGPNVFLVRSDDRGDVYEHLAEGNNTSAKLSSVSLPEPSDLVVDSVAVPAGASPGELVSISWTLVNRGAHPAQGLIREAAFLSTDDSWDIADPAVGVAEREIHLEPGAQASVALKVDASRSLVLDSHGAVSGLLPGAAPGAYHVIVRTDIAGAIRETDVANNLRASESTIQVAVPDLTPGIPAVVSLDAGGSRTFRLQVDGDQDLRLTLSSAGGMGSNELYVARDRVPVPGGLFDHAAASPFTADQKLLIPSAEAGTYFVLALTRSLSADGVSEDLTLLAETLGFSVESITPAVGGQGQVTSVVTGAGFRPSARILLRSGSGAEFEGRIIDEARSTERRVRWQLATTPVGIYDVVVVNEAGGEAVLPGGFRVEPATRLAIDTQVAAPDAIRQGSSATYGLTFRNNGNTDIPYLSIEAATSFARDIDIIASAGLLTLTDMLPDAFNPAGHDFVYSQEKMASIPMLYRNLPPGGSATASMTFKSPEDPLLLSLYANPLTAPQYVGQLRSHFATLREQIMLHRDDVDPFFVGLAGDREEFDRRYFRVYVALGILEPEEGIGLPDGLLVAGKRSFGSTSPTAENGDDDSCLIFYQDGSVAEFWPCPPDPPPLPPTPPAPPPTPEPTPEPGPNPPGACGSYDRCLEIKARQCGYAGVLHCAALGGLAGILTVGAGGIVLGGLCSALYVNACDTSNPNSLPRSICTPVKQSCDPNDIIGPDGFGAAKWIRRDATLTYTVRFENDPLKATAPAQVVGITHPLAETADVRRFRLGTFGFGPFSFHPPANAAHYSTRLDVTDSLGVYVDVTAGLDVIGNRAFWVFRSVDPETGDQPSNDPFAGFLPVNDDTGAGEGFAEYSIAPAENAATGDRLNALARIIFDINPPLDTPEVFNTIDATPPVSSVAVQPGRQDTTAFHVSWSGTDEGSGIRDFELNVSTDEGPFVRYQEATSGTSLLFIAEKDRTYRFFTIATDNVGNREAMKTEGEAVTVVGVEEEAPGLPASFALHQNYPNPFNPRTTIPFDIAQHADVQIIVYNVLGQRVLVARDEPMSPGHYQQTIDMSTFASGVYFYEIRVMGSGKARFRDVRKLVLVK